MSGLEINLGKTEFIVTYPSRERVSRGREGTDSGHMSRSGSRKLADHIFQPQQEAKRGRTENEARL